MTRDADPADKQGHRPTIHLPSGKKYKGEWSGNKMHGACCVFVSLTNPERPWLCAPTKLTPNKR
jgi:hypothetical protein